MRKQQIAILTFFTALIATALLYISGSVLADGEDKRVLFLSSYSYGWNTVQIQIEGIKEGIGENITLDYEFMDTKRFPDDESIHRFYTELKYRMERVEPYDVVILGDDAALQFAMKYRDDLFRDIPLVFEGINDTAYAMEVSKDPLITGVLEKLSFEKNIAFARTLYPNATTITAILDDSVTGEAERKSFYQYAANYPEFTFSEINSSRLTTEELRDTLASVEKDTILIYITLTEDASGKNYTSSQSIRLVAQNANVPAFRMVSGGIGEGLLGGNIVSMELSGKIAAAMATAICNGTHPAVFDVEEDAPNIYCIDEAVMRKYNLDLSLIPKDAEIMNHLPTFFEKHREIIFPLIVIFLILIFVIAQLVLRTRKQTVRANLLTRTASEYEKSSTHDFLTGLPNRTKLYDDLSRIIDGNSVSSLFIFDIDNFKGINDTYGHNVGDEVLKEVGNRLLKATDNIFCSYRLAGDEFICILKNNFRNDIDKYARMCLKLFQDDFCLSKNTLTVHISLGIAVYPDDAASVKDLIEHADQAMYSVKKHGKNDYAFYDSIRKQSG